MPKNLLKRPRDPAQLAKLMIDIASGEVEGRAPAPDDSGKKAAAVALGRLGGKKLAIPSCETQREEAEADRPDGCCLRGGPIRRKKAAFS